MLKLILGVISNLSGFKVHFLADFNIIRGLDRGIRDISRSEIAGLYDEHESVLEQSDDPILNLLDLRAYLDCRQMLEPT